MSFSVLMSVYRNDKPEFVKQAVDSVTKHQTLKPDEVVLVVDGPVPDELSEVINHIEGSSDYKFNIIRLTENGGLGNALRVGATFCNYELIARMDADDISLPDRFEKQILFMETHPDIAVSGGQISEFIDEPDNTVGFRRVPLDPSSCRKYYRDRDPLNHMTVIIRKKELLDVGSYQSWHLDEDTYLWGRLLKNGYKISNLDDVLVNVRVGKEMYARRGGWSYFKSDTKILKWKLRNGLTPYHRYLYNYCVRFIVQVLMPNSLRSFVFQKLLRK